MTRRRSAALLLIAFALTGTNCGGGGGGGGSTPTQPPPPPPPPMGLFFEPASTPEAPSIYLQAAVETELEEIWELRVEAEGVEDLFGLAFRLQFPDELLSFRPNQAEEGEFLSAAGDVETEFLVDRSGPDLVTVGLTRLGDEEGVEGSGHLLTLRFAIREDASGMEELLFDRNDTRDSQGRPQDGLSWIAGTIEVLR